MDNFTKKEIVKFIEENDVKFIRLAFCDVLGNQKNISVMSHHIEKAFTQGISFDASAISGFTDLTHSDLLLFPDPSTIAILPWRPSQGRVVRMFCDIKRPDGSFFEGSQRYIIEKAQKRLADEGYTCKIGSECEFYLFKTDENGEPTGVPYDSAGYLDIAPLDKCENIRREICLSLVNLGITTERSHHEEGPGQNEIDFKYGSPLTAAEDLTTFKSVVTTISAQNGLYASLRPKPIVNKSGNGLHINMSLYENGKNIFLDENGKISEKASWFTAGIMNRIREITLFLNPTADSYKRLGEFKAPKYISWSYQNRSQLIRIPAASGQNGRMELRSPDPMCNPFIGFSLLIAAGAEGIKNKEQLPESTDANLYDGSCGGLETLPMSLEEAKKETRESKFVNDFLPKGVLDYILSAN